MSVVGHGRREEVRWARGRVARLAAMLALSSLATTSCGRTVALYDASLAASTQGDTETDDDDDDDARPDDDDDDTRPDDDDDDDDVEPDDDDDDVEPDDDDDDVEPDDDDDDEPDCIDDEDCDGGVCIEGFCFDDPCRDDPCCPFGCFDMPLPPDFGEPGCLVDPRTCSSGSYCDPSGECVDVVQAPDCEEGLFSFDNLFESFSDTLVGAPVAGDFDEGGADEFAIVFFDAAAIAIADFDAPMPPPTIFYEGVGRALSDESLVGSPEPDLALVYSSFGDAFVTIFEAEAGAEFTQVATYELPVSGGEVFGGQFNADGFGDLAVLTDADAIPLRVLFGNGLGSFSLAGAGNPPLDEPTDVVALDVDGDGLDDLVVADESGAIQLFLAQAGGVFTPGEVVDAAPFVGATRRLTTAQVFPGDPLEVIAVTPLGESAAVSFIYVSGPDTITVDPPLGLPGGAADLVAFDHDGDGVDEIAVVSGEGAGPFALQLVAPAAGFCRSELDMPAPIQQLDAGDWDGDGREGLVLVSAEPPYFAALDAL